MVLNEKNVCLQIAYEAHNEVNTTQRGKYIVLGQRNIKPFICNRSV